jgi:UDP-N-acetyl-2-amino-2-deoxyglucuronate dehydrogenase
MTKYALIGAAGYIAPRHMKAIKETGGTLVAALDPSDSVGILDSYFPDAAFFTELERFECHLHELGQRGEGVEKVVVCSPNYLHFAHASLALRLGADAICEKPLVMHLGELDALKALEADTGQRVDTILQLRLHPSVLALRDKVAASPSDKVHEVDLGYFTSRGSWYQASWKGEVEKSGGIAMNIGVHFFDMLGFVFGDCRASVTHHRAEDAAAGYLEFDRARVRWLLSINRAHLPPQTPAGQTTYRSIKVDGEEFEMSGGFTDLHTESYRKILEGKGFGLETVRSSIGIVNALRCAPIERERGEMHPDLAGVLE